MWNVIILLLISRNLCSFNLNTFTFQHSYGFIQCCERQARLFFHFSQFSGTIEHLKIGDPVEFEMTYDRRTGKPIASAVTKIAPEVVSWQVDVNMLFLYHILSLIWFSFLHIAFAVVLFYFYSIQMSKLFWL